MWKKVIKNVVLFVIGVLVGMWIVNIERDPSPKECLSVCVEEFERLGC